MVKLIYDSSITGHHSEYIDYLVKYLTDSKSKDVCFFVVPEELKIKFSEIIDQSVNCNTIQWLFIPTDIITSIHSLPLYKRSFVELKLVQEYATKVGATEVFLLYFNLFQLALCFKRPKFMIVGVLFLQFYRMNKTTWKEKLKYYRKYFTTKIYILNPSVVKVFVLNDRKTVDFLNLEFKTTKFEMLEDPIPQLSPIPNFCLKEHYKIDNNRTVFLHIGSLDNRKGTFEILESLKYISENKQKEVCIVLVGKSTSYPTEEKITHLIESVQKETKVQVIWDNRFVSKELMKSLFDQCDVVLMPYKNTEASSGILGHAMASNKTIITTGTGLLKEIVENYKVGVLLECVNPRAIAHVIETIELVANEESISLQTFIKEHSPNNFAKKIILN